VRGQEITAGASGLSVLEHKWEALSVNRAVSDSDPFAANDAANQAVRNQKNTDIDNAARMRRGESPNGPRLRPTGSSPTSSEMVDWYTPMRFSYTIKVHNTGQKAVRGVVWEYTFLDPTSGKVLGSHRFENEANIKSGGRETVVAKSGNPPSGIVNSKAREIGENLYRERVTIKSVRYSDGSVWTAPN
jgi:hypothetical protein